MPAHVTVEGTWTPSRLVIIEFPSLARAREWYDCPEYKGPEDALPEIERAYLAVRHARRRNPSVPILARAHDYAARDRLTRAGATEVIQPELEAASTLIRHALRRLELPPARVLAYLDRFRVAMDDAPSSVPAGAALPETADVLLGSSFRLTDQSLRTARIRERFGVTVVALTRASGAFVLHPTAETILRPGDTVRVFGLPAQIDAFREAARADRPGEGTP